MYFSYPEGFEGGNFGPTAIHNIHGEKIGLYHIQVEPPKEPQPPKAKHTHDYEIILIVLKGSTTYTVEEETRLLKPMDAVLIPPGTMHCDAVGPEGLEAIQVISPPELTPHKPPELSNRK